MKMLLKVGLLLSGALAATAAFPTARSAGPESPRSAPTYYIGAQVVGCSQDANYLEFRGATNLPPRALIGASVVDFAASANAYSDEVYVPVVEPGFFAGKISPKKGMLFHYGFALQIVFAPFRPKQPDSVLQVIGRKGEKLQDVADVRVEVSEGLNRPAVNPQLMQWSGDVRGLREVAIVPNCGEKR